MLYDLTAYYNRINPTGVSSSPKIPPIQLNYFLYAAGILTYEQEKEIEFKGPQSEDYNFTEDEALAAYNRMLARQDFIDFLSRATNHGYQLRTYGIWLEEGKALRDKVNQKLTPEGRS